MKSIFAPLVAAAALAGSALAQFTVNTPMAPVVCQPLLITWVGGNPPYFLSILPGNQPTAPAVLDFGQVTGNSLTWKVNITAGTTLGLNLRDSTGVLVQSAPFTIQSGTDTSCLNAAPGGSTTTPGTGSTTTPAAPGSSTTPASTPAATTTPTTTPVSTPASTPLSTPASTPTTPATSASGSPSATPTGAATRVSAGVAGAIGAGAAVMALLI